MTPTTMTLTDRLVLGCARLTGGASAAAAEGLVRTALDAGIRHVDTAPSYGMGTAEEIVGQALRRFGGPASVTAKLGSPRDPHGIAKSWLRRARRALGDRRSSVWLRNEPPPARMTAPSGHDFRRSAMQASLEISHRQLGRIDYLLLHDITAGEVTAPLLADLAELARSVSAAPGYASQGQWDADLDAGFPPGMVAQCAAPVDFGGAGQPEAAGPLFFHSIVKAGAARRRRDPAFAARLDAAARIVGTGDADADRIAVLYVAAGHAAPQARLVIASSYRERLQAALRAIASVDSAGSAPQIAASLSTG